MATTPKKAGKEIIKPPTKPTLSDGAKELKKGHAAGGRVLAEKALAIKQGVIPVAKKKK